MLRRLRLGVWLDVHRPLHRQNREVELGHRQSVPVQHPRLPLFRETLFSQHGLKIINSSAENGQHGGGTAGENFVSCASPSRLA